MSRVDPAHGIGASGQPVHGSQLEAGVLLSALQVACSGHADVMRETHIYVV